MPELLQTLATDGALLLFSAAGLAATTVAIVRDTRTQMTGSRGASSSADL